MAARQESPTGQCGYFLGSSAMSVDVAVLTRAAGAHQSFPAKGTAFCYSIVVPEETALLGPGRAAQEATAYGVDVVHILDGTGRTL
jgi:hypothetical protein